MKHKYYRTDEKENAIDFLETAAAFYSGNHRHKWKWLTISLHGALYGFAVLAIQGTNPDRVVQQDGRKASKQTKKKLITLWEALERCESEADMLQYAHSCRLKISADERLAINNLSDGFRNNFEHFMPKLWSIEVSGFPAIANHVCRVIRFLALESGNVFLNPRQRNKVVRALNILSS
jgi:hypothetical protein